MTPDQNLTVLWTAQPKRSTILLRRIAVVVATIGIVAGAAAAVVLLPGGSDIDDAGGGAASEPGGPAVSNNLTGAGDGTSTPDVPAGGGDESPPPSDAPGEIEVPADLALGGRQPARFVVGPNERLLDTRSEGSPPPPPDVVHPLVVDPQVTAVALSISVMATERAGSVLVDGQAGTVEAITVGGAGGTTTNLVLVPVIQGQLTIRSSAGGHLVVDLVGAFEPSGASSAGRFISVDPVEIANLETATEGRDLDIAFTTGGGIPFEQASAVLVEIQADVGTEGGMISIGPEADAYDQMLMWAPAAPENPLRRGLVLLEPTPDLIGSLRYDGGSELTVEVVGYFTNDAAPESATGLFIPTGPRLLVDGPVGPDNPLTFTVDDVPATAALLTIGSPTGIAGQLGALVLPVSGPEVTLRPSTEIDAVVTLLGVFLA